MRKTQNYNDISQAKNTEMQESSKLLVKEKHWTLY